MMPSTARPVLVVDDDPDIRQTLAELLEMEGYAVATAADGEEALRRLDQGLQPWLILLDLMMPVMSGFQFLERRASCARLSAIPVLVISAGGQALRAVRDVETFPKPLDVERLLGAMERYRSSACA